jgi:hypothetical protein
MVNSRNYSVVATANHLVGGGRSQINLSVVAQDNNEAVRIARNIMSEREAESGSDMTYTYRSRLVKNMTPTPHEVGAKVSIVRTPHGWQDGAISGIVQSRYQRPTGSWGYTVLLEDCDVPIEIENTRDMKRYNG